MSDAIGGEDDLTADLNSGEPWSDLSLQDLRWCLKRKIPVNRTAEFLCRSPSEVARKANELGYKLAKGIQPYKWRKTQKRPEE
jgi:hypothetical protein